MVQAGSHWVCFQRFAIPSFCSLAITLSTSWIQSTRSSFTAKKEFHSTRSATCGYSSISQVPSSGPTMDSWLTKSRLPQSKAVCDEQSLKEVEWANYSAWSRQVSCRSQPYGSSLAISAQASIQSLPKNPTSLRWNTLQRLTLIRCRATSTRLSGLQFYSQWFALWSTWSSLLKSPSSKLIFSSVTKITNGSGQASKTVATQQSFCSASLS